MYGFRQGISVLSQNGSSLTICGIAGAQRPRPPFRFSFITFGCMKHFMKSLATSTPFAPFGM